MNPYCYKIKPVASGAPISLPDLSSSASATIYFCLCQIPLHFDHVIPWPEMPFLSSLPARSLCPPRPRWKVTSPVKSSLTTPVSRINCPLSWASGSTQFVPGPMSNDILVKVITGRKAVGAPNGAAFGSTFCVFGTVDSIPR